MLIREKQNIMYLVNYTTMLFTKNDLINISLLPYTDTAINKVKPNDFYRSPHALD